MKKISDRFENRTAGSIRPALLLGLLVVVLILAGMIWMTQRKTTGPQPNVAASNATPVEVAADPHQASPTPAAALPSSPTIAKASTNATGNLTKAGLDAEALRELIRKLKDPSLSADERNKVIKALAQNGSPEALAALKDALATGSEALRVAVAEGLGNCASQECAAILMGLLHDPSEAVIEAAVRGLALQGTPQSATALTQILYDTQQSLNVRAEAIEGLGTINQPGVMDTLAQAANLITDEGLAANVLQAIGARDISETQPFFENYLRSPTASTDLKVEAVESLWQAKGSPSEFLATVAANPDADLRAAAAWAMSATDENGKLGPQVMSLLQGEADPDVRLRLYQALSNQENLDVTAAFAAVQKESDPAARVAGLDLLAKQLRDHPTAELQTYFEQTAIPELRKTVLSGETSDERMAAVIALTRARTPGAMATLQDAWQQTTDPRVKASLQRVFAPQ